MEAMAMSAGHSVPIYKRDRSLSSTKKKPILRPPRKFIVKKKKSAVFESDTECEADAPGQALHWPPPSPTPADKEPRVPTSETASTITLPTLTPPAPLSPNRPSTSRSNHSIMPRRASFTKALPSRGHHKRTSEESLSDTPFTDLVSHAINSSSTTSPNILNANQKNCSNDLVSAAWIPDRAHQHAVAVSRKSTETSKTSSTRPLGREPPPIPPLSPCTVKSPPLPPSATKRDFRAYLQHATSSTNVHSQSEKERKQKRVEYERGIHLEAYGGTSTSGRGVRPAISIDTFRPFAYTGSDRGSPLTSAPPGVTVGAMSMMPPAPNQAYPPPPASSVGSGTAREFNPQATYQHIQEMSSKRVNTLDYLRKTHEGRVYWYNTLLFSRPDILKLPSFSPARLARRATNFLLLGLSLPAILDPNSTSPLDYLRALNALLSEFESYQQIHPPDGAGSSSLSRARMPRFFSGKGAGGLVGTGGKGRRSSSAADIGAPLVPTDSLGSNISSNGLGAPAPSGTNAFASAEQELLPGEEYQHLLTPSLPFDPDFFEVFATLCDVLIETYMRISALVSGPERVGPGIAEVFAKADARLRKIIVSGVVKEFEDATRAGVKGEVAGVGRVVFGGLI